MYIITESIENLKSQLNKRRVHLQYLIRDAKQSLDHAPSGCLRAASNGGRIQFYWRKAASERGGTYIKKENTDLVNRLAQKEYDEKILICNDLCQEAN
ncbi:MAG: hypothetical protein J5589_06155 [Firmicutes bacterium]|nr:hypothetical protein [Bacillota bacterium]